MTGCKCGVCGSTQAQDSDVSFHRIHKSPEKELYGSVSFPCEDVIKTVLEFIQYIFLEER